ncbi:GGDEF domain-containing protein [Pseudaminobacter salicylatoxidans]|uniref:GGDEF domain-containing protein n=1 Tax=Pseudaminobacter salicylatoxidans TaxID=93369 RepID=UPI0002E2EF46|nr:GGDEF domain-containing protein [Pseudaminobacter salicylatoxidans]
MRFHQSESAFFVLITVILLAGMVTVHAYGVLSGAGPMLYEPGRIENTEYLARLLFATGVLLATALFFGVLFIYPQIRSQVKEEGKLRAMTAKLSARSETLEQAALTDALTGMHNRRYFDEALKEYLEAFGQIGKPVGLMILDLDHFKLVNDTHGHDIGDEALRSVAGCLRGLTRYHDVVARLGGEEFAVLVPNMESEGLVRFAERIRKAIAATAVASGNIRLKVTASVGLAVWDGQESAEDFFRRADQQLYQAKRQGRNRVCA